MAETEKAPNCLQCISFKVSWDSNLPRICTLFKIKTRNLPSIDVYKATGHHCPGFVKNDKIKD